MSRLYFGTCERCKRGFCYEDERMDGEFMMMDFYERKKTPDANATSDMEARRERIREYQSEHSVCQLCERRQGLREH